MEPQEELAVHDLPGQGGDEGSTAQGRVLELDCSVHGAATLESVKKEDEEDHHFGELSTEFVVAAGTPSQLAGSETPVLGASSSAPAPVKASGSGSKVAIAHASPPDSYRRQPSRSRKQHSPQRFVATQPAALAGRLGPAASASPSSSAAAAEGSSPRGDQPNGSARIYVVLAILGAALALSVVSCLLFYVVGRRIGSKSGPPPPGEKQDE